MKLTVCVARIEDIHSLRCFVISPLRLRSYRISAQRDLVRLDHFSLTQQLQGALFLEHQHAVSVQRSSRSLRARQRVERAQSETREYPDTHAPDYSGRDRAKCYADEVRISGTCTSLLALLVSPALAASWAVSAQPPRLLNGAPVLFKVHPSNKIDSLSGMWFGHQLTFSYDASTKTWFALAGVSFNTKPGRYTLALEGSRATGHTPLTFSRVFIVSAAHYPKTYVHLEVEKKFTEPDPEQLKQIDEAKKVKDDYLNRVTPDREWDGNFTAPADAETSDVFGSQRVFNGVAQREHQGLDYRVHTGTPVAAMNSGTVLLARFLYFEGNCVVIDHGQGLLTLYFHLSEFKVKEGDAVKRGQEIGLSGGTGRATGPHLHVAVRWQGTYLDPARLLQMSLP